MSDKSVDLSRRAFLATGAALTAVAAAGVSVVRAEEAAPEKAADEGQSLESSEVREYDLVIVGGGFSGCCAAMEASDTDKHIALVEKNQALGGNCDYTEGVFGLNSQMQRDAGIEVELDVPALVHNELQFTNWRTDGRVWYDVFNHSGEDIDWFAEHNIIFEKVDDYNGVSTVPCFHWWEGESGLSMGVNATAFLETKENVDVMLETEAVSLKMDGDAVVGVFVQSADGTVIELDAPAVIMATGGFVDNTDMVKRVTGDSVIQTLGRGYDGKGHQMMVDAGAKETVGSSVNNIGVGSAEDHYFLALDDLTFAAGYQSLLTVNEVGERFVDENLFNEQYTVVWANALKQQKAAYTFLGQNLIKRFEEGEGAFNTYGPAKAGKQMPELTNQLEEEVSKGNGVVFRGETVEELAEAAGMDPEVLAGTIERYNGYCESGVDEEFACPAENLHPTGEGPYYLIRVGLAPYTTTGGIQVDRYNRVIGVNDEPVPGLYSCGVEGCSLFKETYNYGVSGGQGAYNLYSGRNAAKSALGVSW